MFQLIFASLRHHWRTHSAVAIGVAVATAVLTGALLVGDSVRGSLRDLTLQRLGKIDQVLVGPGMFRAELADEIAAINNASTSPAILPTMLLRGTLFSRSGKSQLRANKISVIGISDDKKFWGLENTVPPANVEGNVEGNVVALSKSIAEELGVAVGDEVLLQLPKLSAMPSDSPLGNKDDTTIARRVEVAAILFPQGLARFSLTPSQHFPRNAFVPLAMLQDMLDQPGRANALLIAGQGNSVFRPTLTDYGIRVDEINDFLQISSDRLVLPDAAVQAVKDATSSKAIQPAVTYLANTLSAGNTAAENTAAASGKSIPYSTVTGITSTAELGPLLDEAGQPIVLADDEIVLNRWAADRLEVSVGDEIALTFFEPESTHGVLREHGPVAFKLKAIAELADADGNPTRAADPQLTPELAGVTDQRSISDWDLPFELTEPISRADEVYWDDHSTTPKAFVSFATAKRLWQSRWGTVSLIRLPAAETSAKQVRADLEGKLDPAAMGFSLLPVKQQGLAASAGTTPFDGLFLGFSFFLIAAAVMLIVLLFGLGIQQRASEAGVLAAVGVPRRIMFRLFGYEGLVVAMFGAMAGIVAGIGYAWLMLWGLKTIWLEAIATPFLELHITGRSLAIGWLASLLMAGGAVLWSLRQLLRLPVRQLLAGNTQAPLGPKKQKTRRSLWIVIGLLFAAVTMAFAGQQQQGEAQAGMFFGSGAAVLIALLMLVHRRLIVATNHANRQLSLLRLAVSNASRNPGRSLLTIGLVASACFLVTAISAFRLDSDDDTGTGGFAILATSDQPLHFDLNSKSARLDQGFADSENRQLASWHAESLRVHDGEDASCLSLYKPTQPRVLGVPSWSTESAPFAWAATLERENNPWHALATDLGVDSAGRDIVPVVIDMNTAMYSLQIYSGIGSQLTIRDSTDQPVVLQIVGLLKNSVLQGNLLISEASFLKLYPDTGGHRFFLLRPKDGKPDANSNHDISETLEHSLSDYGFDATDANDQLASFLAVQNTYLSTFQSLGALGLLLGTVGLAIVQLRNVLGRRGELALMRSSGFPRWRLVQLVLLENGMLLGTGLLVGILAATVALLPHWAPQGASVPWATLLGLLAAIAFAGSVSAWLATRRALSAPLVPALRGD